VVRSVGMWGSSLTGTVQLTKGTSSDAHNTLSRERNSMY